MFVCVFECVCECMSMFVYVCECRYEYAMCMWLFLKENKIQTKCTTKQFVITD